MGAGPVRDELHEEQGKEGEVEGAGAAGGLSGVHWEPGEIDGLGCRICTLWHSCARLWARR